MYQSTRYRAPTWSEGNIIFIFFKSIIIQILNFKEPLWFINVESIVKASVIVAFEQLMIGGMGMPTPFIYQVHASPL
jgi:hypothetical protein